MKKKNGLMPAWNAFNSEIRQKKALESMTYSYSSEKEEMKVLISLALVFWYFVRNKVIAVNRKNFCSRFLDHENKYISLVAYIEMLPDKVWRKILWEENIDFVQHESTLRRITEEQIEAIKEAYQSLYSPTPKIPKVFNKSFFDFLKILFGFITPAKLLAGPYGEDERKMSKGAWAFNLLGFDFGFSLYPQGENDDTMITNKKFTRFLSIKEHINDFIVNQEDGIYWFLYRTARSNYVWRPNKEVYIKNHVCPGFWATLFIHLLFWIVSPVGFIILLNFLPPSGMVHISFFGFLLLLLLSFTPVWLSIVLLKVLGIAIVRILSFIFPPVGRLLRGIARSIAKFFGKKKVGRVTMGVLGVLGVTTIVVNLIIVVVKSWNAIISFLIKFVNNVVEIFTNFFLWIWSVLSGIIDIAMNYPISFFWGLIPTVVFILCSYILWKTEFNEEYFAKHDKKIRWLFWVFLNSFIILGIFSFFGEKTLMVYSLGYSSDWALVVNIFTLLIIGVMYLFTIPINSNTIDDRLLYLSLPPNTKGRQTNF